MKTFWKVIITYNLECSKKSYISEKTFNKSFDNSSNRFNPVLILAENKSEAENISKKKVNDDYGKFVGRFINSYATVFDFTYVILDHKVEVFSVAGEYSFNDLSKYVSIEDFLTYWKQFYD